MVNRTEIAAGRGVVVAFENTLSGGIADGGTIIDIEIDIDDFNIEAPYYCRKCSRTVYFGECDIVNDICKWNYSLNLLYFYFLKL